MICTWQCLWCKTWSCNFMQQCKKNYETKNQITIVDDCLYLNFENETFLLRVIRESWLATTREFWRYLLMTAQVTFKVIRSDETIFALGVVELSNVVCSLVCVHIDWPPAWVYSRVQTLDSQDGIVLYSSSPKLARGFDRARRNYNLACFACCSS